MPVTKKIVINGEQVRSIDDFYDEISRGFSLPVHFGRNLDALWDTLSGDMEGPFQITWKHAGLSKSHLGRQYDAVIVLLHDLEAERDDFRLFLEP